jgi:hypothetical protein
MELEKALIIDQSCCNDGVGESPSVSLYIYIYIYAGNKYLGNGIRLPQRIGHGHGILSVSDWQTVGSGRGGCFCSLGRRRAWLPLGRRPGGMAGRRRRRGQSLASSSSPSVDRLKLEGGEEGGGDAGSNPALHCRCRRSAWLLAQSKEGKLDWSRHARSSFTCGVGWALRCFWFFSLSSFALLLEVGVWLGYSCWYLATLVK